MTVAMSVFPGGVQPSREPERVSPLIEISELDKSYGAFKALEDVRFDLMPGEVHVLFGENGAGKSTLIQVLCGVQKPDKGLYRLFGETVATITPAEARRRGVSVVFQEFSLVPEMTVEENLFLGHELGKPGRMDKREMRRRAKEVLERLGFDLRPDAAVGSLRRASQQMVEIAKALVLDCRVLVLDEPTASLTDHEAGQLFDIVEKLRDDGLGIIYVTHRMSEIDRLADRITVLRDGKYIATVPGPGSDHQKLVELMTGRSFDKFFPDIGRHAGETLLQFDDVTLAGGLARHITLQVRAGEVLGLAGLVGCGKSEVIRAAFGLEKTRSGRIRTGGGYDVTNKRPRHALAAGICYIPSDRAAEGLAMRQSLVSNATVAALDEPRFSRFKTFLKRGDERGFTREIVKKLKIRTPSLDATADHLSGGNKQKLMIARGMSRDFDVVLFDEPTVGVDVQAKVEIYDVIKALTEAGKAVVIASSELAEVLHLSHRLIVMREGDMVGELDAHEVTEEAVLSLFFANAGQEHEKSETER